MDLRLVARVVVRFRMLVVCGVLLATVLAMLTFARVTFEDGRPGLSHRKSEVWASYARVLVAQPGFAWGSSQPGGGGRGSAAEARAVAEGRLPTLATIYASFVSGDEVRNILRREGPIPGVVQAQALPAGPNGGAILPIVSITALSDTAARSRQLGDRAARALRQYISEQQTRGDVPVEERIELRSLNRAGQTELLTPRSKTIPIAVFLAVLFATLALAIVLENLSPSLRAVPGSDTVAPPERVRRAAS